MNGRKRVVRFFLAWQDEAEERWLEEMARRGWHLTQGGILFTFEKGAPAEVRYRLDYRSEWKSHLRDYLALFRDAGWEHVCNFGGWQYFRSLAARNAPEVFTDNASRVEKYRRFQRLLFVLVLVPLMNIVVLSDGGARRVEPIFWVLQVFALAVLLYSLWRLHILIQKLKERPGRVAGAP